MDIFILFHDMKTLVLLTGESSLMTDGDKIMYRTLKSLSL